MHPTALFDLATQLVREVLLLDAPSDSVVSRYFRLHKELGARERHALAETAYAVLRQKLLLANLAQSGHGPLERRLVLLAWQGQEHVLKLAINPDEVSWLERCKAVDITSLPDKLRHNLPDWLSNSLRDQLGAEEFWELVKTLSGGAPLDLRVNPIKSKPEAVLEALKEAGIEAEITPFAPTGIRIHSKPALQKLPLYTGGHVEVQDEGSQLLALLTGAKRGEMVVDFCAGAGGKTLALGAMMRNTGRLYAFDVSGHRLEKLKPRLARSGLSNVYSAQIAHERDERIKRLTGKIDRVLVDAPCSGMGTLRRNPDLKWRQSPKAIEELKVKQAAILDSAARLLKSGGRLVYATCSLMPAENEVIADAFTAAHPEFVPLNAQEALTQAGVPNACGRTATTPTASMPRPGSRNKAHQPPRGHEKGRCVCVTHRPFAWVSGPGGPPAVFRSEQAFLDVNDVVGLQQVVHGRLDDLGLTGDRVAAVDANATFGAAQRQTTRSGQGLQQRGVAQQHHGTGTLYFTVDVDLRRAVHPDGVAIAQLEISLRVGRGEHFGEVDFLAEGLAVALARHHHDVRTRAGDDAARLGQHFAELGVAGDQREAARFGHQTQHRDLVGVGRQHQDGDLGLLEEVAVLQALGDLGLGIGRRQATDADVAQQRVGNRAGFGDAGLQQQIGVLVNRNPDLVTRTQDVLTHGGMRQPQASHHPGRHDPTGPTQHPLHTLRSLCL